MGRTAPPAPVEFLRSKYGRELLVDAGWVSGYRDFDRGGRPHVLLFHDILLVTRGKGRLTVDGTPVRVAPRVLVASAPGQVRRWRARGVEGACIFFTEEFLAEAFRDPRFVGGLACFRPERARVSLTLTASEERWYRARFRAMQSEIADLRADSAHALRALLYEVLVWLDRAWIERFGAPPRAPASLVERFHARLERDFRTHHRVADYARALGVGPGHLNARCREGGRPSAGARIRARLTLEARRLLLYGDDPASAIAERLGFADPAYFARFFRRETGLSPTAFRRRGP